MFPVAEKRNLLGLERHAVRFLDPTGAIFSEPLPLADALRVATRLRGRFHAVKLLPAEASAELRPLFAAAASHDLESLWMPGVGAVRFVREQCDVLLPETGGRGRESGATDLSPENIPEQLGPGEQLLSTRPVAIVGWTLLVLTGRDVIEIASSVLCEVTIRVRTSRVRRAADAQA